MDKDDVVLDAIALSASADGITGDELVALKRMARELPSYAALDDAAIEERIRASFARLHRDGLEGRLRALADVELDDELRSRIFAAAVIVQYADGKVTHEESEFLLDLADVLGLHESQARGVIEGVERALHEGEG